MRPMGSLWVSVRSWFTGEPEEYLACPSKHAFRESRMKWEEEVVEYYEQCVDCGKEFYAE